MMLVGRAVGIGLLIIGIIGVTCSFTIVEAFGAIPRILASGSAFLCIGLAMVIFPGGNITTSELQLKSKPQKVMWTWAPTLHKVMWIVAGIIGISLTFWHMHYRGLL